MANLDEFQAGTGMKPWLCTIMWNTFCTKFGLSKREYVGLDDDCATRSVVQPAQDWSVRDMKAATGRLPEHYRAVLDLIFSLGANYEVAAQSFGCPIATVESCVNWAREI